MLVLDIVYDADTGMESGYCLSGDRNRSMGILHFTHEFTVYLRSRWTAARPPRIGGNPNSRRDTQAS